MKAKNQRWIILDRAFINSVITVCAVEFSQVGSGLIDGIITGRMLGSEAMASIGIGYTLFSIAGIISGVLALGMQSAGAEEIGRGNFKTFNEISSMTIFVGALFALLFSAVVFLFSDQITAILGARGNSANLFEPTREYIRALCIGAPALILGPVIASAIQLDNGGALVRKASFSCAIADVFLDCAAVKLNMGVFGMGIATSISLYINVFVLLFHFARKNRMIRLTFQLSAITSVVKFIPRGGTIAVKRLANVIRPILINNYIIALGGTAAMSAMSVKNHVNNFAEIIGAGIAGAVPLMMGIAYGEKSISDILHIGQMVHKAILFGTGGIAAILAILASPIAAFFVGTDSEIHNMVVFSLYMVSAELITLALIASRIAYLNVISRIFDSQLLQLSLKLLAIVPSVLVMGKLFGVYGVLAGFAVAYVAILIIIFIITAKRKKSVKILPKDYLHLDESFDVDPGNVIELDIRDMNDAVLVSEQIHLFCRGHKLENRKSFFAALATEEAVRLIYEDNGFAPSLRMDIRVVIQNGELTLRIRDNGKSSIPFGESNPEISDDSFESIGLKILRKTAKDINYYHTMQINYTVITV